MLGLEFKPSIRPRNNRTKVIHRRLGKPLQPLQSGQPNTVAGLGRLEPLIFNKKWAPRSPDFPPSVIQRAWHVVPGVKSASRFNKY
jgi:hypothetical protein